MQIREATVHDLDTIRYFESKFEGHSKIEWGENPFLHVFFLEEDRTVGFMAYQHIYERYELDYIFIEPSYRKKGYASILLKKLVEDAMQEKAESISLEVRMDNEKAIGLYQKFGFKTSTVREHYYGDTDGYLMVRKL